MIVRLKSPEEIEKFRIAGKWAAIIMRQLIEAARPGILTQELDKIAKEACIASGLKPAFLGYHGFPSAICSSINEELVHGIPGVRVLKEGDILKLDVGIDVDGFIGDIARTVVVGKGLNKMVTDCHFALLRAIAVAKAGNDIGDIGEEISRTAKEGGWSVITNYGGHGLDRHILHADPFVSNTRTIQRLKLRPGMVFAIEPMFVDGPNKTETGKDGWVVRTQGISAHWEHTIAITEIGDPIVLTGMEEE